MRLVYFCLFSLTSQFAFAATDCTKLYNSRFENDLKLTYQQFDQTEGTGFRTLAEQGCSKEAADLIVAYIQANQANQSSLRWHIAQLRATEGRATEAIQYAKSVLSSKEDFAKDKLRWNDYVLATIAFLERNKERLIHHRDLVAAGKDEHFGNALNLKLLDALIKHFDRDYQYATSRIEQ